MFLTRGQRITTGVFYPTIHLKFVENKEKNDFTNLDQNDPTDFKIDSPPAEYSDILLD